MTISNQFETVACDFCGSAKTESVVRQTDLLHHTTNEFFSVVRCTDCGLSYTNPRPAQTEIGRYYSENYSFHAAPSALRIFAVRIAEHIANTSFAILAGIIPGIGRRLAPLVKPAIGDPVRSYYASGGRGSMLDIGCGAGASAHFWGERGALLAYRQITQVVGIEISDRARASLAAKGVEVQSDIADIPEDQLFGMIRMNWSLEHVYSPLRYFEFVRDHLEKEGRAVIAVPNYEGLIYKLAPECVELPIHLYHFRPHDIENYARRCGLRIAKMQTFSYPQMFVVAAQAGMFSKVFATPMGLREARQFQAALSRFDSAGRGNDMIVELAHE
jgi:SAM-dependent methyltransferase